MAKYNSEEDVAAKKDSAVKGLKISNLKNSGLSERDATIQGLKGAGPMLPTMGDPTEDAGDTGADDQGMDDSGNGPTIQLEVSDLENLGIEELPAVGDTYKLYATVQHAASDHSMGSEPSKSVTLQVTKMCLDSGDDTGSEGNGNDAEDQTDEKEEGQ